MVLPVRHRLVKSLTFALIQVFRATNVLLIRGVQPHSARTALVTRSIMISSTLQAARILIRLIPAEGAGWAHMPAAKLLQDLAPQIKSRTPQTIGFPS